MLAQISNEYISLIIPKTNTYSLSILIFQKHVYFSPFQLIRSNSSWGRLKGDGVHTLRYYLLTYFLSVSLQCGACLPYLPDFEPFSISII